MSEQDYYISRLEKRITELERIVDQILDASEDFEHISREQA